MNESGLDSTASGPLHVERWPSEMPLFVLVILGAIAVWCLLAVTVIGAVYALFLGVFFFFTHLTFVAHLRGSAIRLGPDQFPELHARGNREGSGRLCPAGGRRAERGRDEALSVALHRPLFGPPGGVR